MDGDVCCTLGTEDEASLHAGCRRQSVSRRRARETRRLCPLPSEHRRPIGSQGNLSLTNLPNGRAPANPQGRTKFPSEEPSEENLGDYCLYRILTTNDHLTRGEKRQLDITGPSAGTLPKGIHLDAFALGHVSCSQSAPTVPHRKFQNKHTSQGLYMETPIPKEGGQKKPTVRYRLICSLIFTKSVLI